MRRPRGPGGRFLTADEVAAIESGKGGDLEDGGIKESPDTPVKGLPSSRGSGQKRKAGAMGGDGPVSASKKSKNEAPRRSTSAEESEEPEDEDEGEGDGEDDG